MVTSKSIMRCIADAGNWLAGRRPRRPRSSTAKASKARKRGVLIRRALTPARNQGQEAPSPPRRHSGFPDAGSCPFCRHSGPRRGCSADGGIVRTVSFIAEALRRQRLPRTEIPGRIERGFAAGSMLKSSSAPMSENSSFCPSGGWSSGPSDGSIAAAAWPKTGSA